MGDDQEPDDEAAGIVGILIFFALCALASFLASHAFPPLYPKP